MEVLSKVRDAVVDGLSYYYPTNKWIKPANKQRSWKHVDQCGDKYDCYQSQIVWTDTSARFMCTPSSFKYKALTKEQNKEIQDSISDYYDIRPKHYEVKCNPGSVILWKSNTIHSSCTHTNIHDEEPRCVNFVTWLPLSYFNRNVYYETLKVGNLDLIINNVTLEAIPVLRDFISASNKKFKTISILIYFKGFFDDLDEDNLYEYLEKAIKLIHRIDVELDDTLFYFLYLLQIPRKVLNTIYGILIKSYEIYISNPGYPEINLKETIESLWFNLKEEIYIEESIEYYILLIEYTYYAEDYDDVLEILEEAAEIYLENGRYDLYFVNYTNTGEGVGLFRKYLGVLNSDGSLSSFTLNNYIIECGDIFYIHDPLLDYLPDKMRDKLLADKNSTYRCNLDKSRANVMKDFLKIIYHNSHSTKHMRRIYKDEIILLLIDLKLIYRFVKTMNVYTDLLSISVKDFLIETNVIKLKDYVDDYNLINKENEDFTDGLWIKIKLLRKNNYIYNHLR